jgi:hypothetical protein
MKQFLLILLIFPLISFSAVAQKKKRGNRFDTTLSKKHELSISIGWAARMLGSYDFPHKGNSPCFAIEYARVYKSNHFLRTGLRYSNVSNSYNNTDRFFSHPVNDASYMPDKMPAEYAVNKTHQKGNLRDSYAGAFVGYEYGVGVRSFRFTFGADLHFGYNNRNFTEDIDESFETRTYDMATNMFTYNIQYLGWSSTYGNSHNIFLGLSPRIGIRRDIGRRIALALVVNPMLGYSSRVSSRIHEDGNIPIHYSDAGSYVVGNMNADFRVIFKLGKD